LTPFFVSHRKKGFEKDHATRNAISPRSSSIHFSFTQRATREIGKVEEERKNEQRKGAKGILDPRLLTFRKSLSSIISRSSCFPDAGWQVALHIKLCIYIYIYIYIYICMYVFRRLCVCCINSQSWSYIYIWRSYNTNLRIMWHAQDTFAK